MEILNEMEPKISVQVLIEIIKSQYAKENDGTATAVLLACEIFKRVHPFVVKIGPHGVYGIVEEAIKLCSNSIQILSIKIRETEPLQKCVANNLHRENDIFPEMIVKAIKKTTNIGILSVSLGSLKDSQFVCGLPFKFDPGLHGGSELKQNEVYKMAFIESKLDTIEEENIRNVHKKFATLGIKIVLFKLSVENAATQYFAEHGVFCVGDVPENDFNRMMSTCNGDAVTTVDNLDCSKLGTCTLFEVRKIGGVRFNILQGERKE